MSCSIDQSEKVTYQEILLNSPGDSSDQALLNSVRKLLNDTAYGEFKMDTTNIGISIKDDKLSVFFKKLNKITDGKYIENSGYLVGVKQNATNKYSRDFIYLAEEVIESTDSTWDESVRLLTYPCFFLKDYDGNGIKELQIQQRVYNGTFYQAVIGHFFNIDTITLNLNHIFSIETISYLPMEKAYIHRIIESNQVKVFLSHEKNVRGKFLGEYTLRFDKSEGLYIATDIKNYDIDHRHLLITSSPTGILPYLKTGFPK
jgi:hypothetical protein